MVDEYQDTNTIQERILLLLAGERAICASWATTTRACTVFAGPPSATSWSSPRCSMRAVQAGHASVNYRSHPDIIRFYNEWMQEQTWNDGKRVFRFAKKIVPREDDFP
jgi:DNA helicase-2/ATP-dependent DNA helicase PcrA